MAAGTPHLWQVQLVPPVDDGVRRARLAEQPRHWWAFCATILALSRFEGDPETWNLLLGFHGPGSPPAPRSTNPPPPSWGPGCVVPRGVASPNSFLFLGPVQIHVPFGRFIGDFHTAGWFLEV